MRRGKKDKYLEDMRIAIYCRPEYLFKYVIMHRRGGGNDDRYWWKVNTTLGCVLKPTNRNHIIMRDMMDNEMFVISKKSALT